jgi:SAM-dependent methyltransferase
MEKEKDYVLGTHDEEILRLGLQHRVWRPRALDAWRRAGFTSGQTLLDVGCGPGYASTDLAEIVGPSGMVYAIDRSKRFLDALEQSSRQRGLVNIKTFEIDLNESALPAVHVDGAWVRWVFAFVKQPRTLLSNIAKSIKPGGVLVLHEYFDYSTWQIVPKSLEVEEFVHEVMKSWRDEGGEPNIGLDLPRWLNELGLSVKSLNPIIDVISPSNYVWQWLKTFGHVGLRRLVDLGRVSPERAQEIQKAFDTREADPNALMFTPGVLEIIAVR